MPVPWSLMYAASSLSGDVFHCCVIKVIWHGDDLRAMTKYSDVSLLYTVSFR